MPREPQRPAHWTRAGQILELALSLRETERGAFVARACGRDRDLLAEVESLLDADPSAAGLGDVPVVRLGEPRPQGGFAGCTVGRYRLDREIGRGGTSVVYRGVRTDGEFDHEVAVKLLWPNLASPELLRRFHPERQLLAGLRHPHIARLFDGGTTADDLPYLVMELIDGGSIVVQARRLEWRLAERLSAFLKVCSAVDYAHRNLIVHRDLKPSNILADRSGEPKLLDFGIAKLMASASDTGASPATGSHQPMTPRYASPEQLRGEAITTATDVYSLGVVLFELLAGEHPLEGSTGPAQRRDSGGGEPTAPSPAARRHHSRSWAQRVAGDLDAIVLKALRQAPEERYGSAAAMALGIERYLEGRPVEARRGRVTYRVGKFCRRHLWEVTSGAAVAILGGLFFVNHWVQQQEVVEQRDRAREVSRFLEELFVVSDPSVAQGEPISAREILDRSVARIERELSAQPELRATLLTTMGRVYLNLGLFDTAVELLESSLRLKTTAGDTAAVAGAVHDMARARWRQGAYDEAEGLFRRALDLRSEEGGRHSLEVAESLHGLAVVLRDAGRLEESEEAFEEALGIRRRSSRQDDLLIAESLNDFAALRSLRGDKEGAEGLYREVLGLRRSRLGESHPAVIDSMSDLALVLRDRAGFEESEVLLRRALATGAQVYGTHHPEALALHNNLALVLLDRGELAQAAELFRLAVERGPESWGEEHPNLIAALGNLADTERRLCRFEEAEEAARRALELARRVLGEDHLHLATCELLLARVLRERGKGKEAILLAERLLSRRLRILGGEHPQIATDKDFLGRLLGDAGRLEEARRLHLEAVELGRQRWGEPTPPSLPSSTAWRWSRAISARTRGPRPAFGRPSPSTGEFTERHTPGPRRTF